MHGKADNSLPATPLRDTDSCGFIPHNQSCAKIFTKGVCNSYRAAILPPSFPSLFTHAPERFSSYFNQASDTCQQHQNAFYSLLQLQSHHCGFIEGLTLTGWCHYDKSQFWQRRGITFMLKWLQYKETKKKKNVDDTKPQRLRSIDKRCSAVGKRVWERRTMRWVDGG